MVHMLLSFPQAICPAIYAGCSNILFELVFCGRSAMDVQTGFQLVSEQPVRP